MQQDSEEKNLNLVKFKEELKRPGQVVHIKDKLINHSEKIHISKDACQCDLLKFDNCEFKGEFRLIKPEISYGIIFKDCIFHNSVSISYIDLEKNDEQLASEYSLLTSFDIINCSFKGRLNLTSIEVLNGLLVSESNINGLDVNGVYSNNFGISIIKSKFYSDIKVKNIDVIKNFEFRGNTLKGTLALRNTKGEKHLFVEQNYFEQYVLVAECSSYQKSYDDKEYGNSDTKEFNITFNENTFEQGMDVIIPKTDFLHFDNLEAKKPIAIDFKGTNKNYEPVGTKHKDTVGFVNKFRLESSYFLSQFILNGFDGNLKEATIATNYKLVGEVILKNLKTGQFKFWGTNFHGNIILEDISLECLNFDSFSNRANLRLISVNGFDSEISKIISNNSYWGHTELVDFKLNSFGSIEFNNSNISEVLFSGITSFNAENVNVNLEQKREFFKQLKLAAQKQGDTFRYLNFKQHEYKTQYSKLNQELKRPCLNMDWWILFLDKSNDHGMNWVKPAGLSILATLGFYGMISLVNLNFLPVESFLRMFNPAQSLSSLVPDSYEMSILGSFFFLLHKIVLSYLIFQTISAFRKYFKR